MAYGIIHHFPNGTKEQFDASIASVHPSRDTLPKGQLFHAAGASGGGGWTIIAVHDSKESWEQFRDEILMPRMEAGISRRLYGSAGRNNVRGLLHKALTGVSKKAPALGRGN